MSNVPDVIQFQCASCGSVLTVPSSMAGVSGPCPVCSNLITSPTPQPIAYTPPAQEYPTQSQIPVQPMPGLGASPAASVLPPRRDPMAAPYPQPANEPAFPVSQPQIQPQPIGPAIRPVSETLPNPAIMGGAWPPAPNSNSHPILNSLLSGAPLQSPLATGTATIAPEAIQPNPSAGSFPGLPTALPHTPKATKSVPKERPLPKYDQLPADARGRKAVAMVGTLLMGAMVLAGVGWFFKDQIKTMVRTTMASRAEADPDIESPSPTLPKEIPATKPAVGVQSPVSPKSDVPPAKPFDPNSPPTKADIPPPLPPVIPSPSKPIETVMSATPSNMPPKAMPVEDSLVEVPPSTTGNAMVPQPPVNIFVKATPDTQSVVEALKKFFGASDWKERLKYVQLPEKVKTLMEQYYANNPDGPIPVNHIELLRHDAKPPQGPPHCVFQVGGPGFSTLLPIMVEMGPEGSKVDWLSFTEFKDNLLLKYVQNYQEQPARFHVMIRRAHYFDDDVPQLDKKQCFNLAPPMPGFTANSFVEKGSPLSQELDRNLGWEVSNAAVIVELAWRKQDNYQWLELTGVPQYNWRNESQVASVKSASK